MDEEGKILHHTVSSVDGERPRKKDRGIAWPARHLAWEIGPRAPGSKGERAAAHFIESEFKRLGLAAESHRFRAHTTTAWSEFLVYLIPVIGVLLYPANRHASFGLVFLGFLLYLLECYGRSPFSWVTAHHHSENELARIRPQREARKTVVVIAHMDSPRSAFYYRPGLIHLLRAAFLIVFFCLSAIFMLFIVAYGGYLLSMDENTLRFLWHVGLLLSVPPAIAAIAIMIKAASGQYTPGGNDNASGVAVLIALAGVYTRRRPYDTDLWLVSTGSADADGVGTRQLLRKYRRELRGAYFLVLDCAGRGFPVCFKREGRLIPFRANRKLTALARRINDTVAHGGSGLRKNGMYMGDGFQLLSRGRKAITISSREESRYPRYWRWVKDDYDNIDHRSLRLSVDFTVGMIDGIDRSELE